MAQNKEVTKDCIFTALVLLMEQKEFKYITVTDISRKSGISRMTYYRTYSSKEDILVQHFRKIAQSMVEQAEGHADDALYIYYSYFLEHKKMTELLKQAELMDLVIESFSSLTDFLHRAIHPENQKKTGNNYAARYEAGGLFSILTHWLENDAPEDPEEMAKITLKIMKK
ncbi:MAG: TetR/AcrR family transcriptional regulator [Lachnospiraceae bacterium]|nr:TetR/AcrR family transcriptional regulator [Lachnospiraceae bacterium]